MSKTVITTRNTDLVLRELVIHPTAAGYHVTIRCHEIVSEDGKPVGSREVEYDHDVDPTHLADLGAVVDKVLARLAERDYQ